MLKSVEWSNGLSAKPNRAAKEDSPCLGWVRAACPPIWYLNFTTERLPYALLALIPPGYYTSNWFLSITGRMFIPVMQMCASWSATTAGSEVLEAKWHFVGTNEVFINGWLMGLRMAIICLLIGMASMLVMFDSGWLVVHDDLSISCLKLPVGV